MSISLERIRHFCGMSAVAVILAAAVAPAWSANYPLELVSPRAAGTAPASGFAAMPAGHRIFKAHPGIVYNIRAVVIGGAYPFTYSLANAPSGMTIDSATGEINWPNPQSSASPTIIVTDAEGARATSSWTITVSADGFKFVSPSGNDANAGTLASPWRSLAKLYSSSESADIVYLRAGTYSTDVIPRTSIGTAWERVEFGPERSARWIAYPGETAVVNFGYVAGSDRGVLIRFQANPSYPIYLDDLDGRNFRNIGFQIISGASDYTVLRRLTVYDMIQGVDGENPSGIMFTSSYSDSSQYGSVQNCEFYRLNGGGGLKVYSHKKMVIEDNIFRDSSFGFDLKAHVPRFDVRGNSFSNISEYVLFGNMNTSGSGEPASGELRFNNVNTPGGSWSLDINQDGQASQIYILRNTLVGRVRVRNADSTDGPFRFSNNVIVNDDSGTPAGSHVVLESVSDASRVSFSNDLAGSFSAGIVSANGLLTNEYSRYIGVRGHQLGDVDVPNPPSNVSVQ